MQKVIHFTLQQRTLCGASHSQRHRSAQITSTTSASAVTCKTCLRIMRASVAYESFALFDTNNHIVFPSMHSRAGGVRVWAVTHYGQSFERRGLNLPPFSRHRDKASSEPHAACFNCDR